MGNFDNESREMHKAVCAECKQDCEVPFEPTEDKPVYCKECYSKRKPKKDFNRGPRRDNFREKEMHKAVCDECKKECDVPFKPTGDKPVYCRECYSKKNPRF